MKKYLCLLLFVSMVLGVMGQPQWVAFTDTTPKVPRISLQSSSNQQVRYLVQISGMYQESITVGAETYQRLSIPKTSDWGIHGYPELPAISKLIAVPECDSITIGYLVTDSIVLNNYNVYPKPLMVEDSNGLLVEQFYKMDSIYLLNQFMPDEDYTILMDGYLRNQRIAQVAAYPIKYNPVTDQLIAYTEIEVSLTFNNSQGTINVENGLFNNLTKNSLLNFNGDNHQLPPYPSQNPANVEWLEITSVNQAGDIDADYLIIADDQFFDPPNADLHAFACHRSKMNGFKVTIVSAQDIINTSNPGFPYSKIEFINEQKIRSFLKLVYEGGNAQHTYDGKVAFVLLAGDALGNLAITGVPASKDPNPTGQWNTLTHMYEYVASNDYYYSCLTQDEQTLTYDLIGDVFIGRFTADDGDELENIVHKTMEYESEAWSGVSMGKWRKRNVFAFGEGSSGVNHVYFFDIVKEQLDNISMYSSVGIDASVDGSSWNNHYVTDFNTTGANLVIEYGHGNTGVWRRLNLFTPEDGALTMDYKMQYLRNDGQWPFVIANACQTGKYDLSYDGIAEKITVFSNQYGYVGSLASAIDVGLNPYTNVDEFPKHMHETVPYVLYNNLSTLMGECVLEGRLHNPILIPLTFVWNLFGDPALNLMAQGYDLTHDVTLEGINTISTPIHVKNGAILTLAPHTELHFENNGQLIIEQGSTLRLFYDVKILGKHANNKIRIEGTFTGPNGTAANPTGIYSTEITSLPGTTWPGIEFASPGLNVQMYSGSITNCNISGRLGSLEFNNFTFQNSSLTLDQASVIIDDCIFGNTNIHLTNNNDNVVNAQIIDCDFLNSFADAIIRLEHYPSFEISHCTINYSSGTGIDLYYSGEENTQNLITQNLIQGAVGGQTCYWGVKVYNSFVNIENNYIHNNRYGVACLNNSQVQIKGNPNAITTLQTQNITNNYQNQVRATDNSFPYFLHYNILQNTPTGSTYLIYYDPAMPDPPPIDNAFNVKCNCFDNANPNPQLYPVGWYDWSVWCPQANCLYEDQAREDFEEALALVDSGQYESAETQFKEVISDYPGSKFAQESAKNLIPLTKKIDQDFPGLINYFDTASALLQDSTTAHLIYRLKNKCTVEMDEWEQAITWFEQDILNPASEQDSLFSLIDLSDTYMLMEGDSLFKSSPAFTGSLIQYKPKNRTAYLTQREEWVKLLFSDDPNLPEEIDPWTPNESNIIRQIIPNPFNGLTDLVLEIPEQGTLVLLVHNLLGQEVLQKVQYFSISGQQIIELDLSGLPDGVYLITAQFNGEKHGQIKAVKFN